jgi:hypothetical protein
LTVPRAEPATQQSSQPPRGSPPPLREIAGVAAAPPSMPSPVAPVPEPQTPAPLRSRPDRRGWIIADTGLAICYWVLIVAAVAFGIITLLVVVGVADPGSLVSVFGGSGAGRFVAVVVFWCVFAWLASFVAMVTGWFVCCGIPERTGTRQLIQGSVACVGIAVGLIVLLQVIGLVMTPSMPDPGDQFAGGFGARSGAGRASSPAEVQKSQQEFMEAMRKGADAAKTMARISNIFSWLTALALIAGNASFALFLGALGRHLGQSALRPWSYGVAGLQGALALCMTGLAFLVSDTSPGAAKPLAILSTVLLSATYGGLIYLVYQARRVVPAE